MTDEEVVMVRWHRTNREHFESLGYEFTKYLDVFEVKFNELKKSAKYRYKNQIELVCEYCGTTFKRDIKKHEDFLKRNKYIQKISCGTPSCTSRNQSEVREYIIENELTDELPRMLWLDKEKRLEALKRYLEKYGTLEKMQENKEGANLSTALIKFKDDIEEMVESLGYKYYKVVGRKWGYYKDFENLKKGIEDLIEKYGRFPFVGEITKELRCGNRTITRFGGIQKIIKRMGYVRDRELIDDSGYFNKSSYEFIVAQFLNKNKIPYERDQKPFPTNERGFKSDFTLYPRNGKEIHIEVWGMESEEYKAIRKEKEKLYKKYENEIQLISLEKNLFMKIYDEIQKDLVSVLNPILSLELKCVSAEYLIPKIITDEELLNELLKFSNDGETLPKYEDLREIGKQNLFDEVEKRYPSYMDFAKKYDKKTRTVSKNYWNETKIIENMHQILNKYNSVCEFVEESKRKRTELANLYWAMNKYGLAKMRVEFIENLLQRKIKVPKDDLSYLFKHANRNKKNIQESINLAKQLIIEYNLTK